MLGNQALLVDAVPRLVQDAEKRIVEVTQVVPRGDAAIAWAHATTKGVRRDIEPASFEVEANRRGRGLAEHLLALDRILAFQDGTHRSTPRGQDRSHEPSSGGRA